MKITSGVLRGRVYSVPKLEVRPTKGQVREAIFSSLGGTCEGLRVLDLFAGAGGLGLEAWSRGAASVTFVEQHPAVWKNLKANVDAFRSNLLGEANCLKGDALKYAEKTRGEQYDLIFADPPYDLDGAFEAVLSGIRTGSALTEDGRLVYELRAKDVFELPEGWDVLREKVYGYTRVLILTLKERD